MTRALEEILNGLTEAEAAIRAARGVGDVLDSDVDEAIEAASRIALDVQDELDKEQR